MLYDYVSPSGVNEIEKWMASLQSRQLAKLEEQLDKLESLGVSELPNFPIPIERGIYKLKVHGNVQLRPHLCRGPVDNDAEFTLLVGAREVGGRLDPRNVLDTAVARKLEVAGDPTHRRIAHEEAN